MRTSYELARKHAEALRRLAEELGFWQTRGAGAWQLGNVSALLRALAAAADADMDAVAAALRNIGIKAE